MARYAGIPARFAIGSPLTDFDPMGDWTIVPSRDKLEEGEVTRNDTYYKVMPASGKITGQVALRAGQDSAILTGADATPFLLEDAIGRVWSGTVTYVADGEEDLGNGQLQVELTGRVSIQ